LIDAAAAEIGIESPPELARAAGRKKTRYRATARDSRIKTASGGNYYIGDFPRLLPVRVSATRSRRRDVGLLRSANAEPRNAEMFCCSPAWSTFFSMSPRRRFMKFRHPLRRTFATPTSTVTLTFTPTR